MEDILETIEKQQYVSPAELLEFFWNMFVADAFLGNFDRHNGNWGFLYNDETKEAEIAPVYDCGSCLLPQADEKTMDAVLANENELHARVYQFPTSAIKVNGRKINYFDFLVKADNEYCNEALGRIFPRIDLEKVANFIESVPSITDKQRQFYKRYITARYELILCPAFEAIKERGLKLAGSHSDIMR